MIKNECDHAYKLLDHAECLWCENCVEELVERLNKKLEVTEEWIEKWADKFDSIAQQGLIIDIDLLKQMLKEAGIKISVA